MEKLFTLTAFGFYGLAISGMAWHLAKKWGRGELPGSPLSWLTSDPHKTFLAFTTGIAATATLLLTGVVTDINDGSSIMSVFMGGYMADSHVNGDSKGGADDS